MSKDFDMDGVNYRNAKFMEKHGQILVKADMAEVNARMAVLEKIQKAMNGHYKRFYDSGNVAAEFDCKKALFVGTYREYYDAPQMPLKVEAKYVKGNKHGTYTEFYENGQVKIKGKYFQDVKDGLWQTYSQNGDILEMRRYNKGEDVSKAYDKLRKIAEKRIDKEKQKEKEIYEKTGEKKTVILKKMNRLEKIVKKAITR